MNNQEYDGPVLNIGIEVVLIPRKNGPLQDIDYCRFSNNGILWIQHKDIIHAFATSLI